MSRKDIVIIAMLLNAGLLAVLFMLAIHSDDEPVSKQELQTAAVPLQEKPIPVETISVASGQAVASDEIDDILKSFNSHSASPVEFVSTPIVNSQPPKAPEKPAAVDGDAVHYVEVTVKRGDMLEKIARANGTTVDAIKKANKMTSERLSVGQVLKIPLSTSIAASTPVQASVQANLTDAAPEFYVIKSGDNPWKIARQFKVKFEDLLRMNNLDEEKARNLKVGDKIRVK